MWDGEAPTESDSYCGVLRSCPKLSRRRLCELGEERTVIGGPGTSLQPYSVLELGFELRNRRVRRHTQRATHAAGPDRPGEPSWKSRLSVAILNILRTQVPS